MKKEEGEQIPIIHLNSADGLVGQRQLKWWSRKIWSRKIDIIMILSLYAGSVALAHLASGIGFSHQLVALSNAANDLILQSRGGKHKTLLSQSSIVSPGRGMGICNAFLLEVFWGDGCGRIFIQTERISSEEFDLVMDFLRHPCRIADKTLHGIHENFGCENGKATRHPKILLLIHSKDGSVIGSYKEIILEVD